MNAKRARASANAVGWNASMKFENGRCWSVYCAKPGRGSRVGSESTSSFWCAAGAGHHRHRRIVML